jgi:hypothetical protein
MASQQLLPKMEAICKSILPSPAQGAGQGTVDRKNINQLTAIVANGEK